MSSIDYKALAAEVRELCRSLRDELCLDRPATYIEPLVDRLWPIAVRSDVKGKIGLSDMDKTIVPALFLLSHPGVGVESAGPHSPPAVTDPRMVDEYRRQARRCIQAFLLVQELYGR